jgi:hypothetical protein
MKRFVDLGNECVEYQKVAKASEGKSHFQYLLIFACLTLLLCLTFSFLFIKLRCSKGSLTRVNSTNVLDEGLRIRERATTRDSGIEIGTRRTQVHVPAVEDHYILLAI